jgi:hypothetical protein
MVVKTRRRLIVRSVIRMCATLRTKNTGNVRYTPEAKGKFGLSAA